MNWVDKVAELYSNDFDEINDIFLEHVGKAHDDNPPGRGSGRYAFGSGDRILQRQYDIYSRYRKLKADGISDTEIAKAMGFYLTDERGNILKDQNGEPRGSVPMLRAKAQMAKNDVYRDLASRANELRESLDPETGKRYTNAKIAEILGLPGESSVRSLTANVSAAENRNKTNECIDKLKEMVGDSNYIDVGRGAELTLGVSKDRLNVALATLKEEGYDVQNVRIRQVGMTNGAQTTILTLCPKGSEPGDAFKHRLEIKAIDDPDLESTLTRLGMRPPVKVDVSRISVRYDEEGGTKKDGVIEIRAVKGPDGKLYPACEDLSLGNAKYAQVRIAVDASSILKNGDRYIKGMAVYNTDLPKNVDILVNSNKSVKEGPEEAFKKMKRLEDRNGNDLGVNEDNPFGATVYQTEYKDSQGNKHLSAINIVGDVFGVDKHQEGAWDNWSRNLPSQFLGKQSEDLIKQQLRLKVMQKQDEYNEILQLNNPVVKKQMLKDFADSCDAAAVDLKAAPIIGQRVQVLLPLTTIKENEIYAPNYPDGTTCALVRFPHAGPFETPIVKVNNQNKEAKAFLEDSRGQAKDAIGISQKTAGILSGADFDGDTAIVIPMTKLNSQGEFEKVTNIKGIGNGQQELPGLKDFNPSAAYPEVKGMHYMTKREKGIEMGRVSNLITDMSIKGCDDPEELSRAVRYSMVVIDAEKHKLNYRQAEKDYKIDELREKYQSNKDGSRGPSTLLSRAGAETRVEARQIGYKIDPETGERIFEPSRNLYYPEEVKVKIVAPEGYTWTDKDGKTHRSKYVKDENGKDVYATNPDTGRPIYEKTGEMKKRMQSVSRMDKAKDAYELLSDNPNNKEILYADFANKMKSMGNEARKEYLAVPHQRMDPAAKKKYANEVASLEKQLNTALKNAPRERLAQRIATQIIADAVKENPDMDADEAKRIKGQALIGARDRAGAKKTRVQFTVKEWEAINAGAVSENQLVKLLKNADAEQYKKLATPRESRVSSSTAIKIQQLLNAGWSRNDIVNAGYASMETVRDIEDGKYDDIMDE